MFRSDSTLVAQRRTSRTGQGMGVDCHVQRLTYLSTARDTEAWTPKFLTDWEEKARQRNTSLGVGGFFLYSAPYVFEVLEGFPEIVGPLFELLQRHPALDKCIVLVDLRCSTRMYPDWRLRGVHNETGQLPVMVPTILRQIAGAFLSMWRYLPRSVADLVLQGKDPRTDPPQSQDLVVGFIRLVEFSSLLAQPSLTEHLADLLEVFVDICVEQVQRSGGQFAKFVSGMCMAYWPASCAGAAYDGVCNVVTQLKELRQEQPPTSSLSLLYARAGLHYGRVLICNAGTQKADFTLLGDTVNVAARISTLAMDLKVSVLVSNQLRAAMGDAGFALFPMGPQQVKGRNEPVECFRAPGPPLDGDMVRVCIEGFLANGDLPIPPLRPVREYAEIPDAQRPRVFEGLLPEHPERRNPPVRERAFGCCWWRSRKVYSVAPAGDSGLVNLMYLSHASAPMSTDDLDALRRASKARNRRAGITAELIYLDGLLVHSIEGPVPAVGRLWARLQKDPRHREAVVVHLAPIDHRTCRHALNLQVMSGEALRALPILPEVLGQLSRSFCCLETYVPDVLVRMVMAGQLPRFSPPTRVPVVMMASDIVCFTSLSEGTPLTEVWHLCTTFIDLCTREIERHRGHVIKLIGDCVTAYFPAEAAGEAVEAAKAVILGCCMRRESVHPLDCRSVMACGVGLDYGPVVMAHCGTRSTTKYLVTGMVSSRVMEVEAMTRTTGRKIVLTQPVVDRLPPACPVEPIDGCPGNDQVACYAYSGSEWHLDRHAIKAAIQAYHCAYRAVRGTPFALQLAPAAEEMGVMSTDETLPSAHSGHKAWASVPRDPVSAFHP
eukprot:EG_transcript_2945